MTEANRHQTGIDMYVQELVRGRSAAASHAIAAAVARELERLAEGCGDGADRSDLPTQTGLSLFVDSLDTGGGVAGSLGTQMAKAIWRDVQKAVSEPEAETPHENR